MAAGDVDDRQPRVAEPDRPREVDPLVVRAAVMQGRHHARHLLAAHGDGFGVVEEAGDPAHGQALLATADEAGDGRGRFHHGSSAARAGAEPASAAASERATTARLTLIAISW